MKKSIILCISFFLILMQFNELLCQHSNIKNNTRFNSLTGHVKRIYNADIEVPGSSGIEIAKKYLELNNKLIGNQKELSDLTFIKSKKSHDVQHFFFKQNYNGIEVINSGIVISLNKENKITTVYSDYFPIVDLNTIPSLSVIEAEAIAKNAFKNYDRNNVIGKSELKIYADKAGETHLVYEVSLNMENFIPLGMVLVDSHNGSVLEKSSHGQSFITGKGKVFDPDPGTYFRDATLTASSNVDAAYKTNVNLTNLDGNGNVQGRYAKSINSNYLPNDLAYNSQNNFSYIRTQTYFKEVNVYYFINKMREYIGTLGISPTWKDGEEFLEYDASVNSVWAYGLNAVYFGTSDQERLYFAYNVSTTNTITPSDDLSVIVHEYGHALHDALISGGYESITDGSDSQGISEGIGDYLAISFRRTLSNGDFRPNHRSNYFRDDTRMGIKSVSDANYSLWGQGDSYYNGAIWASTLMDLEYNNATNPASGNRLGRDVTTKLLLKSLSYIPITASAEDYVYAVFQADRDLYGGTHLSTLESVFDSRGFLSRVVSGGNITTNTTWNDKIILVTGNVTVNSGVTLTISSGAYVYFDNGIYLTVNGGLNATNTTFTSTSTSWGGIKFNSGSSGNLNSCIIEKVNSYGGAAISLYSSYPTIQNCTIRNNTGATSGIFSTGHSSGGKPDLYNNIFENNTAHGIYLYNGDAYLKYNKIRYASSGNAGIKLDYFSYSYFNSVVGGSGEGRNTFENNYYGIYTNYYSDVHAGDNSTSYHRNRFINNTYHIYANNNSNVYAKYCYWNPQDFVNKIVKLNNSNVYTDNPISDPGMSVNRGNDEFLSASSVGEDNNEKKILLDMLKNYYTTNDKTIKKSTKDFVKDLLSIKSKTDDITPFVIEILSNIEMYDKELNEVIKLNESLVTDYKNTIYAKNGFMNLFFAYYEMNDYKNASQALSQISEQYQNNDEVLFAKWLIGSEEESIKFGKKSEAQETEGLIPINFQLIGNYPNPFNPTTTITYILPSDGLVQVKVFDILGREIETLVNDFKSSGKHSILWDGSKFASGMYFCSVAFKNQTLYKKMLMVK